MTLQARRRELMEICETLIPNMDAAEIAALSSRLETIVEHMEARTIAEQEVER